MAFEARHNGVLVARHEDAEHLKKIHAHLDGDGLEVSESRPYELHALGDGADAIIDSFHSFEEARSKWEFYANPIVEDGVEVRPARFPKAEIRDAAGGRVLHPASVPAPEIALESQLAASEATTDPAPPEPLEAPAA